jgi:hypothetical protein
MTEAPILMPQCELVDRRRSRLSGWEVGQVEHDVVVVPRRERVQVMLRSADQLADGKVLREDDPAVLITA